MAVAVALMWSILRLRGASITRTAVSLRRLRLPTILLLILRLVRVSLRITLRVARGVTRVALWWSGMRLSVVWGTLSIAVAPLSWWWVTRWGSRGIRHVIGRWIAIMSLQRVQVSSLDLLPKWSRNFAVAELGDGVPSIVAMAMAAALLLVENVILALPNGLWWQKTVDVVPARMLINPSLYGAEHILLDLNVSTAKGRVVECAQYVVDNFIYGNVGVLPCIENAAVRIG
jgi:hypothetical protein